MSVEDLRGRLAEAKARCGVADVPDAVVAAALCLCLAGCAWGCLRWRPWEGAVAAVGPEVPAEAPAAPAGETSATAETSSPVVVHVVGAVARPGVYELPAGSRVAGAIGAAGGLLSAAAEEAVNMARLAVDGEQILVPTKDQVKKQAARAGAAAAAPTGGTSSGSAGAGAPAAKVDINTAGEAELDVLPGVGPATARKIVQDREANGPFKSPEDLMRVPGIGPKKFEAMKDMVLVG